MTIAGDAQHLEHALDDALGEILKARAGAAMFHLAAAVWLAVCAGDQVDKARVDELLQQIHEFGYGAFPSWREVER
jgi:predicted DNA-binding protein (MmcQ/YjbR family)